MDSKSCCTFAFATQKRGVSERARRSDWSEVSDTVSREVYGKLLWGFLPSVASERPMGFLIPMGLSKKKLLRIFGGFKNLLYLCTHNPQEKAVRSSRVKRP